MDWRKFLEDYGYYAVHFTFESKKQPTLSELRHWMSTDQPKYTGWSPFWWPTRPEIAPQVIDQATYECIHDGTGRVGHIERWNASTAGSFTIVRAYDCDYESPGKYLDLTLPAWRIAELLLYAGRMAQRFQSSIVQFTVRYEGLSGRVLRSRASPNRMLLNNFTTKAKRFERRIQLPTDDIETGVIEITDGVVRGLFELFQFQLPASLCEEEIARMKMNRF